MRGDEDAEAEAAAEDEVFGGCSEEERISQTAAAEAEVAAAAFLDELEDCWSTVVAMGDGGDGRDAAVSCWREEDERGDGAVSGGSGGCDDDDDADANARFALSGRHFTVTRPVGSDKNHSDRCLIRSVCFWWTWKKR